ncbi:hypothetical protein [Bradyrhizobium guangdongense]|uniref:hypothetical protein n=1 Tax=Bradyrhizobium guangdongense TaxID=1325090 RepID=UPI00112D5268|nr:hypothetical protein [Bradyrhizobium guangdongense]
MSSKLTQGIRGSLRKRVRREIREHMRENRAIRRARYSLFQRTSRFVIVGRSLPAFLATYLLVDLALTAAEILVNLYCPQLLPGWTAPETKGVLKDFASYLIAAQVGLLGIVSVAIGIVTLISQRDDRSSTNTDIRLYYMESLAYEVVLSGAALLIVLCTQLLWPAQFLTHLAHLGGTDLLFKAILTTFHLSWLLLNLAIFAQFVLTTLRFVEPSARGRLRERYTANVIVPNDLGLRLLRAFYGNAPKELVLAADNEPALLVTFGHSMLTEGDVELREIFASPTLLNDVWLRPLGFVLRGWWRRSAPTPPPDRHQSSLRGHDVWLSFEPSFEGRLEGEVTWCRRRGGVAFQSWERWVIRQCYRFRDDPGRENLPKPSDFLEELADGVIAQIERNAITAFKGAFDELTRFHVFLLEAHNTRTDQGQPISFAEVGDFWDVPHREWLRQYRRLFDSASDKIGVETTFIDWLSHTTMRLLPGDAAELSPPVVTSLLDLGIHEVIVLEDWVTRRATLDVPAHQAAQPRLQLAGSERRAYESVIRSFTGAWENVLRIADSLYGFREREGRPRADLWNAFSRSMPFLDRHLRNTAYLLASAVWNEDEIGAEWYRDCLLRWLDTLRPDMHTDFFLAHHALLTPDVLSLDWAAVEARVNPYRRDPSPDLPPPQALFAVILRGVFDDVLLVTALLALAWHVNGQQSSDIGARAANLLLRRQVLEGEGSRFALTGLQPPTVFRQLFSLIVRTALGEQGGNASYGTSLDGLVQTLNGMSERHVVPGRVYTSWGWRGLDQLRLQVLAMLAASLPATGDDGVGPWVREFASNEALFAGDDAVFRRLASTLRAHEQALGEPPNRDLFERGVHALTPEADVEAARTRLQAIFADAIAVIHEQRTQRLRTLPIDPKKWNTLVQAVSAALSPELYCFRGFRVEKVQDDAPAVLEYRVNGIDKSVFVTPSMSWQNTRDLNRLIPEMFRDYLTSLVWYSLRQSPRESIDVGDDPENRFWDAVVQNAQRLGPAATLLTSYDPFGAVLARWTHSPPDQRPVGRRIAYVQGHPSGGGTGYVGTIDDIEVFTTNVEDGHSYLFSATLLDLIAYRLVAPGAFVTVEFEESDNPWSGTVVVRFAQEVLWRDGPVLDLIAKDLQTDEDDVPVPAP